MIGESREPTKVDVAAAESCSRSGTFALILSLALIALVPYWLSRPNEKALNSYLALRLNLAVALEQLDFDPYWAIYLASNPDADSMTIAELTKVRIESPQPRTNAESTPPRTPRSKKRKPGDRPSAPINLRFVMNISQVHQIADLFTKLNDADMLTKSRQVSLFHDLSIFRWAIRRHSLYVRNMSRGAVVTDDPETETQDDYSVPQMEELLTYMTLRDVRELASYELPLVRDSASVGSQEERVFSAFEAPRGLYPATLYAQVLLLFVIIHFGAFAREAVSVVQFPAPGTLFSAFQRSPWTLATFVLCVWLPFASSLTVAIISRDWVLLCASTLIGVSCFAVHRVLQKKAYFGALSRLPFSK